MRTAERMSGEAVLADGRKRRGLQQTMYACNASKVLCTFVAHSPRHHIQSSNVYFNFPRLKQGRCLNTHRDTAHF